MSEKSSNDGGAGGVIGLVLVGCVLVVSVIWNLLITIAYFAPRWVPPALFCGACLFLPSAQTWFVCRVFKQHRGSEWTKSRDSIRAAWRLSRVGWLIPPFVIMTVLLWNVVLQRDSAWLASCHLPLCFQDLFHWNQHRIQAWYEKPFRWPLVLTVLPALAASVGWHQLVRAVFVWRIQEVNLLLLGTDMQTERLAGLDKQLSAGYSRFGSSREGCQVTAFQAWIAANIGVIIRDTRVAKKHCDEQCLLAAAEWLALQKSFGRYEAARSAYQKGLARLRQASSMALLGSLEDAGRILVSPGLIQLVESQQWDSVNVLMDEVGVELGRIDGLADEWAQGGAGLHTSPEEGSLTQASALELLGLAENFVPAHIHERRKQFARIYHPDMALDPDQRERNNGRFSRVNAACDLLLNKVRCENA